MRLQNKMHKTNQLTLWVNHALHAIKHLIRHQSAPGGPSYTNATLLSTLLLFVPSSTLALPSDKVQPIHIGSNMLKIDEKKGESTYIGDVLYRQGTIVLKADKAVVNSGKDMAIKQIKATGNKAKFKQQIDETTLLTAEAKTIKFNSDNSIIELIGDAFIKKNNDDTFTAEYITYDVDKKLITSQGGRTEITIHPNKEQKTN